jgi:hypothetical protein
VMLKNWRNQRTVKSRILTKKQKRK